MKHNLVTEFTFDLGDLGEHEGTVSFMFIPASPGRMYMSNGDPGYPDDPEELDIISVKFPFSSENMLDKLTDLTLEWLHDTASDYANGLLERSE